MRLRGLRAACAGALVWTAVQTAGATGLAPLAGASTTPPAPWRQVAVPAQKMPRTLFEAVDLDGARVLKVEATASYGNLVHAWPLDAAGVQALSWRWRVDRAVAGADLRHQAGDDAAVKVCVMFDHALDRVPFIERQLLRIARAKSGEPLPAATLCYVWAPELPAGTVLPNAYTNRMRWIVLQGTGAPLGAWRSEQRDLRADFLRAFGDEASDLPRLTAVLVGADADNTGAHGLAYLANLGLQ